MDGYVLVGRHNYYEWFRFKILLELIYEDILKINLFLCHLARTKLKALQCFIVIFL